MATLSPTHSADLQPVIRELLRDLSSRNWAPDFYLAGSLALTAYLGHRPVENIDLMGAVNRLTGTDRRDLLADLLEIDPATRVETARDGYLFTRVGDPGITLKFFHYPYPLVDPLEDLDGMALASAVDLGLMKLGAIISRGRRRDFVDLYLLCRRLPLAEILRRAPDKYGHVRDFPVQALKGLADRPLVEDEPMPPMHDKTAWQDVERWLDDEVLELAGDRFGLTAP